MAGSLAAQRRRSSALVGAGVVLACVFVLAGAASAAAVAAPAVGASGQPVDVEGAGVHADAVRELHGLGVLAGTECASGGFCWGDPVTREVAAVWIVRVLDGGDGKVGSAGSRFSDVAAGGGWAAHIERLAELGVTVGCAAEPPARFCPHDTVTRAQAATFLARAFELGSVEPAGFGDTAGSVHEADIDALHAAGVTRGCSTELVLFCPRATTTRAQLASFLSRARTLDTGTDDTDVDWGGGGAPRVVALVAGDGWLAVRWAPPEDDSDGTVEYLVQWNPAAAAGWDGAAEATVPAGSSMHTIEGLANGVLHTVHVRADPAAGEGAWSGEVTGSAAAAPPRGLSLNGLQGRIVVAWQPPDSAAAPPVARYVVQWTRSGIPYDATRSEEVPAAGTEATIYELGVGAVWRVRVSAVDAVGRVLGRSDGSTRTESASDAIEREVVEGFEEDFPWLGQTWDASILVTLDGSLGAYWFQSPTSVATAGGTNWPNLREGLGYAFAAWGSYTNHAIVMHEMAHHFTLDVRVPGNTASTAAGWLYFDQLVGGHCSVGETYADVLAYHTSSGRWGEWAYLEGCAQAGRPPDEEALAVVASISDGEIPQWLFDTYSTDGTADTTDLDRLWSDVKALPDVGSEVAYGLHAAFGGYCSDKEAISAHWATAPTFKNPWVQGGCETRRPGDLTAAPGSSGAISVRWTAPHYATTPTVDAYVVQWKGDGEQYDSSRQALVTDLSSLSYTITGLVSGEQHRVRVAAVGQADTADFVDDDGRTRADETDAAAG